MDIVEILNQAAHAFGPSGQETEISSFFADKFRPYVDEVYVDNLYNVIAHKKGKGPKVMLSAHQDEICCVVSKIEGNGALRLWRVGGIDPKVLPGCRVIIHTKQKNIPGICCCTHPTLLKGDKKDAAYDINDIYVDTGINPEEVKNTVRQGDMVTFDVPLTELKNNQVSCKTMDDRACVAILLDCARRLKKLKCDSDVYFVASSQEEVGAQGAYTAAFNIHPDFAIALDVDFAAQPGCSDDETIAIDSLSVTEGPFVAPKLLKMLRKCAKHHEVKLQTIISPSYTGTDTDEIGISADGVPAILMGLPEKYMHTTVEVVDTKVISEGGRLLSHFLSELDKDWEDDLWI